MTGDSLLAIPPQYQLLVTLFISFIIAAGAVVRYFNGLKKAPESSPIDMKVLGAAFASDRAQERMAEAVCTLAAAATEICKLMTRDSERGLYREDQIMKALSDIASALEAGSERRQRAPAREPQ